jgi:Na+/H+ antiporter NhaD/arsenite permease-like protein
MTADALEFASIPVEFVLFGIMLAAIAIFHRHTLGISLFGLTTIIFYKLVWTGFKTGPGIGGLVDHLQHEWVILINLLCLLVGFALLADHFERSRLPAIMPRFLPDDWKGGFTLLALVWVLSSFLDNIAGALIGGAMAHQLFRGKVHIAFVAAIVASSNAGGAWSVIGDTTTTMMWISGIAPGSLFKAIFPAAIALFMFGIPAAIRQQSHSPIMKDSQERREIDWIRAGVIGSILTLAILANIIVNSNFRAYAAHFPVLGLTVWLGILVSARFRQPNWSLLSGSLGGSIFLLALVLAASLMPVEQLPSASWQTAFGLGFLSPVFDNIPLAALALRQGGYDWGFLAYAVGFGGSMIWFGSSAGVAICNMYPEARSVWQWVRHGWAIPVSYVVGFFAMLWLWHWNPDGP